MFLCPNCQLPLVTEGKAWYCRNHHTFDVGKNGDVNLLLPQQKRTKSPGDSKAMVAARRDFLASGAYQPIASSLGQIIMESSNDMPATIADAGCGEGYYLRQIQQLCQQFSGELSVGWDISKFAVQSAAKQAKMHEGVSKWLTASNANIPLANDSIDVLLCLFGFEVPDEFARIVKTGGLVVTADVGKDHLIEIRERIYPEIKPYQEKPLLGNNAFQLIKRDRVSYQITLNNAQLGQLLLMTPHFFRAKVAQKERLLTMTEFKTTIDANFRVYLRI